MIQIGEDWLEPEDIKKLSIFKVMGKNPKWMVRIQIIDEIPIEEYFPSRVMAQRRCEHISDQKKFIYAIRK